MRALILIAALIVVPQIIVNGHQIWSAEAAIAMASSAVFGFALGLFVASLIE